MAILNFFRKKPPVLFRCTHCCDEQELSRKEVRAIETQNSLDPVCPAKLLCHMCHIGFLIPVKFIGMFGNQYLFHEIKPKIKNLPPETVMQRIFEDADPENIHFFGFFEND